MAQLGDITITVQSENPTYSNRVTEKSIENGSDIADHVKSNPTGFAISGVVVGEDAGEKYQRLVQYRDNAELLTYVGRNLIENLVIENLSTTHDNGVGNGFTFNITLKQVKVVTAEIIEVNIPQTTAPKSQINKTGNKGKQQQQSTNIDDDTFLSLQDRMRIKVGRGLVV